MELMLYAVEFLDVGKEERKITLLIAFKYETDEAHALLSNHTCEKLFDKSF